MPGGFFEMIWMMTIFGEDARFWMTVLVASLLKWLFSPKRQTARDAIAGMVAGGGRAGSGYMAGTRSGH